MPDSANRPATVLEMCIAAEEASGRDSIVGAQEIRGLWRIYPGSKEARTTLLIQGIKVRQTTLQVSETNPFVIRGDSGEEKPSTKVLIDDIPISVADTEIEDSLVKAGCELRSEIKVERARDVDGKLTRFITGRRFIFITIPTKPLDKTMKVSFFTARIYHKEQKMHSKPAVCSRCLQPGHWASQCEGDIVCRVCKKPGHKKGDPACQIPVPEDPGQSADISKRTPAQHGKTDTTAASSVTQDTKSSSAERGRPELRQKELLTRPSLPRHRSETPRKRSADRESPSECSPKGRKAKKTETPRWSSNPENVDEDSPGKWGGGEGWN